MHISQLQKHIDQLISVENGTQQNMESNLNELSEKTDNLEQTIFPITIEYW